MPWPVRRQTYGYLPSCRASPPFGRHQIILLGDRSTWLWTTCLDLLPCSGSAGSWTHDLSIANPTPWATKPRDQTMEMSWPWVKCEVDSAAGESVSDWRRATMLLSSTAAMSPGHLVHPCVAAAARSRCWIISGTPGSTLSTTSSLVMADSWGTCSSTDWVTAPAGGGSVGRRVTDRPRPANREKPIPATRHSRADVHHNRCHSLSTACQTSSVNVHTLLRHGGKLFLLLYLPRKCLHPGASTQP